MRCTAAGDIPWTLAMSLMLQWVAPSGFVLSVASTTWAIFSFDNDLRRPGRVASFMMPSTPSVAKRWRHRITVGRDTPRSAAIVLFETPSAALRMMRARCATFCGVLGARSSCFTSAI